MKKLFLALGFLSLFSVCRAADTEIPPFENKDPAVSENFRDIFYKTADISRGSILFPDGTVTNPSIKFQSEQTLGIYRSTTGAFGFAINGVPRFRIGPSSVISAYNIEPDATLSLRDLGTTSSYWSHLYVGDGGAGDPSISFGADSDNGLQRFGANNWGLITGGATSLELSTTKAIFSPLVLIPDGTLAAPGIAYGSDQDTGVRRKLANTVAIVTDGTDQLEVTASSITANLNMFPDASHSIVGCKVVTYTGTGGSRTVAHGLGRTPNICIFSTTGIGNNIPHLFITGMLASGRTHDFNGTSQTDAVTAADSTNITMGGNAALNQSTVGYAMVCF